MLQNYDLIIFDLDGVLVDSELLGFEVYQAGLKDIGIDIDIDFYMRYSLGYTSKLSKQNIYDNFGVWIDKKFEQKFEQLLFDTFTKKLQPTINTINVLKKLNIPKAIGTSSSMKRAVHSLKCTQLYDFFKEHIYSGSLIKNPKPSPDIYISIAKQFGVAVNKCLVIEDSPLGVQAAKRAQMSVWHYRGASHFEYADDRFLDISADKIIYDMNELLL